MRQRSQDASVTARKIEDAAERRPFGCVHRELDAAKSGVSYLEISLGIVRVKHPVVGRNLSDEFALLIAAERHPTAVLPQRPGSHPSGPWSRPRAPLAAREGFSPYLWP